MTRFKGPPVGIVKKKPAKYFLNWTRLDIGIDSTSINMRRVVIINTFLKKSYNSYNSSIY